MPDKRFFCNKGPFYVKELAELTNSVIIGNSDKKVLDVAAIDIATEDEISFIDNKKYIDAFKKSKAGVCIAHPSMEDLAPKGMTLLLNENPYLAYAHVSNAFYKSEKRKGIHKKAIIDKTAKIGKDCFIDAGVVIGKNVELGNNVEVESNVTIAQGVIIGDNTIIGANASISHSLIGKDCYIYTGSRIGQDGFGFAMSKDGHTRIVQMGRVIIEDNVEIGANCTIDRGAGPDTIIKKGAMIDNLVQIGHNAVIGENSVIVSQTGVSGSTHVGKFCVLGGQVGVAGHLKIGDGAQIAAKSGVISDIDAGQKIMGYPAMPNKDFLKQIAFIRKLMKKNH